MSAETKHPRSRLRDRSLSGGFIPGQAGSENDKDENEWWTDRELSLIENALREHGEMKRDDIFIGYVVGAVVMMIGGVIQALMGVEAAQRDLEDIAPPLSAQGEQLEEPGEKADRFTVGTPETEGTR